jgi:hypothetical protein
MNTFPEYESFKHGLIVSKIWLCEELEKIVNILGYSSPNVHILAAWDNLLSFMMLTRNPYLYKNFFSYDINSTFTNAADKICNTWLYDRSDINSIVKNITADVNMYTDYTLSTDNIFINCSVDQIESLKWYNNIPNGSLVCLQTTDIIDPNYPWFIKTITPDIDNFRSKFSMKRVYYSGSKNISYNTWGYNRLMIIGVK